MSKTGNEIRTAEWDMGRDVRHGEYAHEGVQYQDLSVKNAYWSSSRFVLSRLD
jgi:hypothetical protein